VTRLALHARFSISLILVAVVGCGAAMQAQPNPVDSPPPGMAVIPAGIYRPSFRGENDAREISTSAFYLDILPVTNEKSTLSAPIRAGGARR
jgi:hypothetical protein